MWYYARFRVTVRAHAHPAWDRPLGNGAVANKLKLHTKCAFQFRSLESKSISLYKHKHWSTSGRKFALLQKKARARCRVLFTRAGADLVVKTQ
jgi:hypothetical protein